MSKVEVPHRKIKRQKDLDTITGLFSIFPSPLVDKVLDEATSDRILTDHIDCLLGAERVFRSPRFQLYDKELLHLLDELFREWNSAWDIGRATHHEHENQGFATLTLCDTDPSERWDEHDVYLDHVSKAQRALANVTKHLHEVYPDFNLVESDAEAIRKYREMERRVEKRIEELSRRPKSESDQPLHNAAGGGGMSEVATRESLLKIERLKELLVLRATNKPLNEQEYADLRRELMGIPGMRDALPDVVRKCGTIREFWTFITPMFDTEKHRRRTQSLQEEFMPILEALESGQPLPDQSRSRSPSAVSQTKPRPDLVIVTVNEHETQAVHDLFLEATGVEGVPISLEGRLYYNLGTVNDTTVYHALSEMGPGNLGAMQQTVDKAIRALDPGAVIAAGIAFGVNKKKQAIGDILISKQLRPYDLQRAGEEISFRDDKPHATTRLINHFALFAQTRWKGAEIRPGVILTGAMLIDNIDYRNQLVKLEAEAVGGEMEGAGLYVSSHDHKVDWIVIKAICDWADGTKRHKKEERQKLAAKNAAEFLVKSLQHAPLKRVDIGGLSEHKYHP